MVHRCLEINLFAVKRLVDVSMIAVNPIITLPFGLSIAWAVIPKTIKRRIARS